MMFNDGSGDAPKLAVFLNMDNLEGLHSWSVWNTGGADDVFGRLAQDGFEGVQLTSPDPAPTGCLSFCGLDRISKPSEAGSVIARHRDRGDLCLTIHAGWGIEDDAAVDRLVEAVLAASQKFQLPVFFETHRATITQDMWRTVRLTERWPEMRFNGDFSHYYTGQEMVYGGLEMKLSFLQPVFDRVAFMHGRIGSPGWIQAPIAKPFDRRPPGALGQIDYLADFRRIWTEAMRGFRRHASPGDVLIFAPELLSATHYYARQFPDAEGVPVEESDRYEQALLYGELARECFAAAGAKEGTI